jgi:hypothetical protein
MVTVPMRGSSSHWTLLAVALALSAGCGDDKGSGDLAPVDDLATSGTPADLGPATDLAAEAEDLAQPAGSEDLSAAEDLTPPPGSEDLTPPPDLATNRCDAGAVVPNALECSGLYQNWNTRELAPGVQPFAPGHHLWADGAEKSRWIKLPQGQKIDVKDPNNWSFPVGTKLWKEFRLAIGAGPVMKIETRLWWKRGVGDWVPVVYRWNDAQDFAPRMPAGDVIQLPNNKAYEVPSESRCPICHKQRSAQPDAVLGFEAVLLADAAATGLTYTMLQAQDLLMDTGGNAYDDIPAAQLAIPGNATEKAALGYLYANCGTMCHHLTGPAPFQMDMTITPPTPTSVAGTKAFAAINVPAAHVLVNPPIVGANYYRFRPTDVQRSMIHLRMAIRDTSPGGSYTDQMPPLVTLKVDDAGLALVDAWINAMTGTSSSGVTYPAPAAP